MTATKTRRKVLPAPTTFADRDQALGLTWRPEACTWSRSGHCEMGNHSQCQHDVYGSQHDGVRIPSSWVQIRSGGRGLVVVLDQTQVLPVHVWRCRCECHDPEMAGRLW